MKKEKAADLERFDSAELPFYALVSLAPLLFWPYLATPTNAKLPAIAMLVGLILAAVFTRAATGGRLTAIKIPILYPLLVSLTWKVISTAYGGHFHAAIGPLLQVIVYSIVFIGVVWLLAKPGQTRRLLLVAALAAVPVCAIGVMERLGIRLPGVSDIYDGRVYSTTGNPTFLAAYLGLMFPVQLSLFLLMDSRRLRWLFATAACLSFLCVIWTYTRGIWAGLALALPVMLALSVLGPGRKLLKRRAISAALLAVILLALAGVNWLTRPSANNWTEKRIESTHIGARRSDVLRGALIRAGIRMFVDHPLLGVGLGGYQVHYLDYIKTKPIPGNYFLGQDHAHNQMAEVAAEEGVVGLAIYLWLLSAIALTVVRGLKRARMQNDARSAILIAGITAGLIAFFADTMVNVSLYESHVGLFYWLLLGVLSVVAMEQDQPATARPRPATQRAALIAAGLVGMIVLSVFGIKTLLSDVYTYNASLAQQKGDWEGAIEDNQAALKHNPYAPTPLYWLGIDYREAGYAEDSLQTLQLYQNRYPHANRIDFELGRSWFALGNYRLATKSYYEAIWRDRADFPAWQGLAASAYLIGRTSDAHVYAREAMHRGADEAAAAFYGAQPIAKSAGRPHYLIAAEVLRIGEYERAIGELELAVKSEPVNADFLTTLGAAYWKTARTAKAEASLEAAIKAHPALAEPHGYLGMVYLQTGRKARARQELLSAVALSRDVQSKAAYEGLLRQAE